MRRIIGAILLMQLSVGPQSFAEDPPDALPAETATTGAAAAPATSAAPAVTEAAPAATEAKPADTTPQVAAPEKPKTKAKAKAKVTNANKSCPALAAPCLEKDYLTYVFSSAGDCETVKSINAEYKRKGGGKCNLTKPFREKLLELWESRITEAGYNCKDCLETAKQDLLKQFQTNGKKIVEAASVNRERDDGGLGPDKDTGLSPDKDVDPVPRTAVRRRPAPIDDGPIYDDPPRRRHAEAVVETGGGFNSNILWGVGGLLAGGIFGYLLGKNSAQQQQYYPPYGGMLPPGAYAPPGFGGGFPPRPGLPPVYRAPIGFGGNGGYGGGFPGGPFGGQLGGYNGTPGSFGGYNLGNYSQGFGSGFGGMSPIYNGGPAPVILPNR